MDFAVTGGAEPSDIERFRIVVVVRLRLWLGAGLAWESDKLA